MDSLALVFSSGWASGVNAYLVVLVLGLADRFGDLAEIPDALGRGRRAGVAAALMYAMEFVADKIPYVDSAWDAISTAIRPDRRRGRRRAARRRRGHRSTRPCGRRRRRHRPALPHGQGRQPAGDQHLARAGQQHRRQPRRGRHRARRSCGSRSSTRARPRRSPACCSLVGLVVVYLVAKLVRRGWRRLRGRRTPPPTVGPQNPVVPGGGVP